MASRDVADSASGGFGRRAGRWPGRAAGPPPRGDRNARRMRPARTSTGSPGLGPRGSARSARVPIRAPRRCPSARPRVCLSDTRRCKDPLSAHGAEADPLDDGHHRVGDVLGELDRTGGRVVQEGRRDAAGEVGGVGLGLAPVVLERLPHQAPMDQHVHAPVGRHRFAVDVQPRGDGAQGADDLAVPVCHDPGITRGRQARILMPLPVPQALRPPRRLRAKDLGDTRDDLGTVSVRAGSDLDHGRIRDGPQMNANERKKDANGRMRTGPFCRLVTNPPSPEQSLKDASDRSQTIDPGPPR